MENNKTVPSNGNYTFTYSNFSCPEKLPCGICQITHVMCYKDNNNFIYSPGPTCVNKADITLT